MLQARERERESSHSPLDSLSLSTKNIFFSFLRLFLPFPPAASASFPDRQNPLGDRLQLRQPRLHPGHALGQIPRPGQLLRQRPAALGKLELFLGGQRGRVGRLRGRSLEQLGVLDRGRRGAGDGGAQGRAERVQSQGELGGVVGDPG